VTLYHALAGQPPFTGAAEREVREAILGRRPLPLAAFGVGDSDLQRIIDRALDRDPAKRLRTVAAIREALEAWLARAAALPPRPPRKGCRSRRTPARPGGAEGPPPPARPGARGQAPASGAGRAGRASASPRPRGPRAAPARAGAAEREPGGRSAGAERAPRA